MLNKTKNGKFDQRSAYGRRMQSIENNPLTLADKIADLHKEITVEAKKVEAPSSLLQTVKDLNKQYENCTNGFIGVHRKTPVQGVSKK